MDHAFLRRLPGDRVRVSSHETRVLTGGPAFWIVEEGSVAVSCAVVADGAPIGPRRLLFRGGSNQPLWVLPHGPARALRLLAVPVTDALLRVVSFDTVARTMVDVPQAAETLFAEYATSLTARLRTRRGPLNATKADGPGTLRLGAGEGARPDGAVLWLFVEEGEVQVCGHAPWTRRAEDAPLLWTEDLWVVAPTGAKLRCVHGRDVADVQRLAQGAAALERIVLEDLEAALEEEERAEEARLCARTSRQGELTANAAEELAASLEPGRAAPSRATPLLTAIGAVCDTMGVAVRAPAASERRRGSGDPVQGIARATGVRIRRVLLQGDWRKSDCGPLLAFQGEAKAPVALLLGKRQRYELFDPVARTQTPLTSALEATLHPDAVAWYPPLPARPLRVRDLFAFPLRGRLRDVVLMLATAAAATLLGMLVPQATAVVMDVAVPDANRRLLLELGLALLAAAFGQLVFRISQSYVSARLAVRAQEGGQAAVWDRLLAFRPSFFRGYSSGDLMDRAMSVHKIGERLTGATLTGLFAGLMALLNLGLLLYYSVSLAGIAVLVAFFTSVLTTVSAAMIRRNAVAVQEVDGRFRGFQIQVVQGVSKLRVAGAEPMALAQWMRRYGEQLRMKMRIAQIQDGTAAINLLLSSLSTAALFFFGYSMLTGGGGGISVGVFLAFTTAYGTFLAGAGGVSNTLIGLFDVLASAKRLEPILAETPEVEPGRSDPGLLRGRVAADQVTFRYRDDGPPILDDVSLHAEPGEFVAIVGASGSGKSTLLRILLAFEQPESGAVYYDGMDLAGVDVRSVRRQLGVVLQGGRLTQGSILENISPGAQLSLDDAWDAARRAGLEEELRAMPMGMHTILSEGGTNLSGGQRQRLLIARALAHRPKLVFFDEATSALDNRTQAIVGESLEKMQATRVVIAHRLSTVRNADRIYVLDKGRVVEVGAYDDLKDAGGLFARMMARQMA